MTVIHEKNILYIYTDGSQKSKPRKGGIGIVFVTVDDEGNELNECIPKAGYRSVTNNEMELQAAIVALKEVIKRPDLRCYDKALVVSDSRYLVDNANVTAIYWKRDNWRDRNGKPVDNSDQWKELLKLTEKLYSLKLPVKFQWDRGHAGNEFNVLADELAKKSAEAPSNPPLKTQTVGRKHSKLKTKPGSISVSGQEMKIHVISTQKLPNGLGYKHRYELLETESPKPSNIDNIYSDDLVVWGRHCFRVKVNSNPKYPRIEEVYEELNCKTGEPLCNIEGPKENE